jgi:hypothetical protein
MLKFVVSASTPFIGAPCNTFTCNVLGHSFYSGHPVFYSESQVFQNESVIQRRLMPSLKLVRFAAHFAFFWTATPKSFLQVAMIFYVVCGVSTSLWIESGYNCGHDELAASPEHRYSFVAGPSGDLPEQRAFRRDRQPFHQR